MSELIFIVAVPFAVQLLRLAFVKAGKPIPILAVQTIAAALAVAFVFLNGGFAGLAIPVFAGDPVAFVGGWLALLVAAWGPVELSYRLVLKALFAKIGLA